jgi:cytochrome c biogenesis protein CcmG/thiol:disulfide interchange protein DsbE
MRRLAVPAVITAVAAAVLAMLAFGISNSGPNNSIAYSVASKDYKIAPDYRTALPVLQGASGNRSLASYRGRVVLLNFFASWCEPCQGEAPVLAQAQKLLAAHGGTVVGVTFQNSPSDALGYLQSYHLTYPVLTDVSGSLASAFGGLTGVPDTYLLNRQGKIVALNTYQITSSWVKNTLPQLLDATT